jgi:hypothetical protein
VPITDQTSILKRHDGASRTMETTTIYNVGERRHHTLKVRWLTPGFLFKFLGMLVFYFIGVCMLTFAAPAILGSIMKDKTPTWLLAAWAMIALLISAALTRKELWKKLMTRQALKERGLAAKAKIAIVPDRHWDGWAAKLK